MADYTPLTETELREALERLPEWRATAEGRAIERTVSLPHLPAAVMVVHAARVQDELDHHADILLGYNTVRFTLTSHAAGGALTAKDVGCAGKLDAVIAAHGAKAA